MCVFSVFGDHRLHCLVHSCFENTHENDSILLERWEREIYYTRNLPPELVLHCVDVETIDQPVLVFEDECGLNFGGDGNVRYGQITVVRPHDEYWPSTFVENLLH